ncbi:ferredoxin [Natronoglycomyces albus]|uniref:Ferredoxin n=1 Tax=Natronoglycomyces albus TaxID=2811108 RepID=A0A895XMA7_9ACTN|nr:ferredoxin [Natronoglycomyces albus]QSB06801.1 ferredoxin [Natronoglycomyces albus]
MRIVVDREVCIGAGMCVLTAPELFDQDESDGRVRLLAKEITSEVAADVETAVTLCPSGAIRTA